MNEKKNLNPSKFYNFNDFDKIRVLIDFIHINLLKKLVPKQPIIFLFFNI